MASPDATAAPSLLRAFAHGASAPSGPALIGAIAVFAAWCVATALLVTPRAVASAPPVVLLRSSLDDYAALTREVFTLRERGWRGPAVVLIGPSALREAIASPARLEDELAARGAAAEVVTLHADDLTLWEIGAVIEALPPGLEGILAVSVSPAKLGQPVVALEKRAERPRLGWWSPFAAREMARSGIGPPMHTGIYAVDNAGFLVARITNLPSRLAQAKRPRPTRHRWKGSDVAGLRDKNGRAQQERTAGYFERRAESYATLGRLLDGVGAGAAVVLLEGPSRRDLRQVIGPEVWDAYHADIRSFAASRRGVTHVDVNHVLRRPDFVDYIHVTDPEAEARYTAALAEALAPLLARRAR